MLNPHYILNNCNWCYHPSTANSQNCGHSPSFSEPAQYHHVQPYTQNHTVNCIICTQPGLGQPKNEKLSQEKSTATKSCIHLDCFHFKVQGSRPLRCKGCPKSASSLCPSWVFSSTPRRPCQQDNGRAPAMQPRSVALSKVFNHLQVLGYLASIVTGLCSPY